MTTTTTAARRARRRSSPLLLAAVAAVVVVAAVAQDSDGLKVGDEVCVTNYIMDTFCINLGTLMDSSGRVVTLEEPEQHSYHCLLDVPQCYESGFVVLTDKDEETDRHCLGYRLDDSEAILAAGRAKGEMGFCTTCTGAEGSPEYGFRATIKGTVIELGDGTAGVSGTPLLEVTEVLDDGEMCETATPNPNPVCLPPSTAAPTPDAPTMPPVAVPTMPPVVETTAMEAEKSGAMAIGTSFVAAAAAASAAMAICV